MSDQARLADIRWQDLECIEDSDYILDAVVLCRVQNAETNETALVVVRSEGADPIVLIGLVTSAAQILDSD